MSLKRAGWSHRADPIRCGTTRMSERPILGADGYNEEARPEFAPANRRHSATARIAAVLHFPEHHSIALPIDDLTIRAAASSVSASVRITKQGPPRSLCPPLRQGGRFF